MLGGMESQRELVPFRACHPVSSVGERFIQPSPSLSQAIKEALYSSLHQLWALLWGPSPAHAKKVA